MTKDRKTREAVVEKALLGFLVKISAKAAITGIDVEHTGDLQALLVRTDGDGFNIWWNLVSTLTYGRGLQAGPWRPTSNVLTSRCFVTGWKHSGQRQWSRSQTW